MLYSNMADESSISIVSIYIYDYLLEMGNNSLSAK